MLTTCGDFFDSLVLDLNGFRALGFGSVTQLSVSIVSHRPQSI